MSIEELSKIENIMRGIKLYIGSGMPLTLVVANMVRVLLGKNRGRKE